MNINYMLILERIRHISGVFYVYNSNTI